MFKFQIYFPGVTICNQNRINCGNLESAILICKSNYSECDFKSETDPQFDLLYTIYTKCNATDADVKIEPTTDKETETDETETGETNADEAKETTKEPGRKKRGKSISFHLESSLMRRKFKY